MKTLQTALPGQTTVVRKQQCQGRQKRRQKHSTAETLIFVKDFL